MYSVKLYVNPVRSRFRFIYNRRRDQQAYAIAKRWASETLNEFITNQRNTVGQGAYWTNRTYMAAQEFYTSAILTKDSVGFDIVNAVPYGIYLEMYHGKKFSAIQPLKAKFYPLFYADMKRLYGADI